MRPEEAGPQHCRRKFSLTSCWLCGFSGVFHIPCCFPVFTLEVIVACS